MKTSKRKRSRKIAPAAEAPGVDVIVAEMPVVQDIQEPAVDVAAELSPAAVEALVAEPVVEVAADLAMEAVAVEVVADALIEEAAAEPVDAHAETVVAESLEVSVAAAPVEAIEAVEAAPAEPVSLGEPIVVLNANCSVKDAAALKVSLCAFSNHSDAVTLDVSAVERVDTATMQLLCAFVRDRDGRQQSVTWRGESQALQDAVRLLGVGALLGFEQGVAA